MRTTTFSVLYLSLCVGCGASYQLTPPPDFVVLDADESESQAHLDADDRHVERATNAQGVVVGLREIENEAEGSLDFWSLAIQNRVRRAGGYALLEEKAVSAATGERGKQFRFGHDEASDPYLYWVTLFVTDDTVYVIEAGARREHFEAVAPDIERTIAAFRID